MVHIPTGLNQMAQLLGNPLIRTTVFEHLELSPDQPIPPALEALAQQGILFSFLARSVMQPLFQHWIRLVEYTQGIVRCNPSMGDFQASLGVLSQRIWMIQEEMQKSPRIDSLFPLNSCRKQATDRIQSAVRDSIEMSQLVLIASYHPPVVGYTVINRSIFVWFHAFLFSFFKQENGEFFVPVDKDRRDTLLSVYGTFFNRFYGWDREAFLDHCRGGFLIAGDFSFAELLTMLRDDPMIMDALCANGEIFLSLYERGLIGRRDIYDAICNFRSIEQIRVFGQIGAIPQNVAENLILLLGGNFPNSIDLEETMARLERHFQFDFSGCQTMVEMQWALIAGRQGWIESFRRYPERLDPCVVQSGLQGLSEAASDLNLAIAVDLFDFLSDRFRAPKECLFRRDWIKRLACNEKLPLLVKMMKKKWVTLKDVCSFLPIVAERGLVSVIQEVVGGLAALPLEVKKKSLMQEAIKASIENAHDREDVVCLLKKI